MSIGFKKNMENIFYKGKIIPITVLLIKNFKNIDIKTNLKIISFSKGKGFCGTIKRYGFSMNNASHGNSKAHRKPGSIGMCQDPGRVFKGKKMCGHMGNKKTSVITNIVYFDKNRIFVKGSISGFNNSKVLIKNV